MHGDDVEHHPEQQDAALDNDKRHEPMPDAKLSATRWPMVMRSSVDFVQIPAHALAEQRVGFVQTPAQGR